MKTYPAIAFFEVSDIAAGLPLADKMLKAAPVALLRSGIVSGGKYLILLAGTVGAVETAFEIAQSDTASGLNDKLFLPDVDDSVYQALTGKSQIAEYEAVTILQSSSIAVIIELADSIIKNSEVALVRLHAGEGYAGNGFALFNGTLNNVQIAAGIARSQRPNAGDTRHVTIIPQISDALIEQLASSLRFSDANDVFPDGGE